MKHIRVYDRKPNGNDFLGSLGCLALMAIFGGALFWGLTTTLDDMTQRDCDLGIRAACEELKK